MCDGEHAEVNRGRFAGQREKNLAAMGFTRGADLNADTAAARVLSSGFARSPRGAMRQLNDFRTATQATHEASGESDVTIGVAGRTPWR